MKSQKSHYLFIPLLLLMILSCNKEDDHEAISGSDSLMSIETGVKYTLREFNTIPALNFTGLGDTSVNLLDQISGGCPESITFEEDGIAEVGYSSFIYNGLDGSNWMYEGCISSTREASYVVNEDNTVTLTFNGSSLSGIGASSITHEWTLTFIDEKIVISDINIPDFYGDGSGGYGPFIVEPIDIVVQRIYKKID